MESDRRLTLNEIHTGHREQPMCEAQTNRAEQFTLAHTQREMSPAKQTEKEFKIHSIFRKRSFSHLMAKSMLKMLIRN